MAEERTAGNEEYVVVDSTPTETTTSVASKKFGTMSVSKEYRNGNKEIITNNGNINVTRGHRILYSQGDAFVEGRNIQLYANSGILEIGGSGGVSWISGSPDELHNGEARTLDENFRDVRSFRAMPQDNRDTPAFNPIGDILSVPSENLNSVSSSDIKITPPTLTGNITTDIGLSVKSMSDYVSEFSLKSVKEKALMIAKNKVEKYERLYKKTMEMAESDASFKNKVKDIKKVLMSPPATDQHELEEADGWYDKYLELNMTAFERNYGGDTYNH